jgi:hypothetical protein
LCGEKDFSRWDDTVDMRVVDSTVTGTSKSSRNLYFLLGGVCLFAVTLLALIIHIGDLRPALLYPGDVSAINHWLAHVKYVLPNISE